MQQFVRDPGIVARLYGDEFAIVLEDIWTQDAAIQVAAHALHALREP